MKYLKMILEYVRIGSHRPFFPSDKQQLNNNTWNNYFFEIVYTS
jgi:hypothetical protein